MKLKIPDKLKVGGFDIEIIKDYVFTERADSIGAWNVNTGKIRLVSQVDGNKLSQDTKDNNFWHELIHGIDAIFNGTALREGDVKRLAYGLQQVFKDNDLFEK